MLAQVYTGYPAGLIAQAVTVEACSGPGLPGITLVGMARGAAKESAVRVRSALAGLGISLQATHVVVNLLPADLPKETSSLDLPLAVVLLAISGSIPAEALHKRRFFGELSLGGQVQQTSGCILVADLARSQGDDELVVPQANAAEAAMVPDVRVVGCASLAELVAHLTASAVLQPTSAPELMPDLQQAMGCLSEVRGHVRAKRALIAAAAGGHNLLMVGPPGSGKTMMARRLLGLLPQLSADERSELTRIHAAKQLKGQRMLPWGGSRPLRAPHHTTTAVALVGGGMFASPGEVTLAHRGVLLLDELPEFGRAALEALREPLEEGTICVARAGHAHIYPARVTLVATMNPCPCGFFAPEAGQLVRPGRSLQPQCLCGYEQVQRYMRRLSGPLLDRIDLQVRLKPAVSPRAHQHDGRGLTSQEASDKVGCARRAQHARLGANRLNAHMEAEELEQCVVLKPAARRLVERAAHQGGLSGRALGRVLKVAQTLADLQKRAEIGRPQIVEALGMRLMAPQLSAGWMPKKKPRLNQS